MLGQDSIHLLCYHTHPPALDKKIENNLKRRKTKACGKVYQIVFPGTLYSCNSTKQISVFLAVVTQIACKKRCAYLQGCFDKPDQGWVSGLW
jgi:hypothetical protein